MFLFCNEDRKKKERLNSLLQTTRNLIKNNEIKDVRKNPVYSLIRAMSNYHLYDIVRELYEDEEVTDVQSIYKDIGEYLINSNKLNNCKSFELGESNINIDLSKDELNFYTGNFKAVKAVSKNPSGSLGWSNCFVGEGICLFLLYLFEDAVPSKAAAVVANSIGFSGLQ